MTNNVGKTDKIIRILIGIVIAGLGVYYKSWFGLLAVIPFGTALMGSCLLYKPFGISTCKTGKKQESDNS
ncbi:MAG: DUF2892 domain-containing protein [Fibrobacterota bacterium]